MNGYGYMIMDGRTANALGDYATREEGLAALREINDPDVALIAYDDDGFAVSAETINGPVTPASADGDPGSPPESPPHGAAGSDK